MYCILIGVNVFQCLICYFTHFNSLRICELKFILNVNSSRTHSYLWFHDIAIIAHNISSFLCKRSETLFSNAGMMDRWPKNSRHNFKWHHLTLDEFPGWNRNMARIFTVHLAYVSSLLSDSHNSSVSKYKLIQSNLILIANLI